MKNKSPPPDMIARALQTLTQDGTVILHGDNGLAVARRVIEHVVAQAGCAIRFAPSSAPDLVDYLTVTTVSSIEGAILGAGLGSLVGRLVGRPKAGLAIGAGIGLVGGASRGVQRVHAGWRVQALRELDGVPSITISAFETT